MFQHTEYRNDSERLPLCANGNYIFTAATLCEGETESGWLINNNNNLKLKNDFSWKNTT